MAASRSNRARLTENIETATTDAGEAPLSIEQRQITEADVGAKLLAVVRQQCFWVERALAEGLPDQHDPTCYPQANLGVRLITTRPVVPGSSPEHAIQYIGV